MSLKPTLGVAIVGAALAFAATGCGTATNHATSPALPKDVRLTLTTPASGLRTSADRIAVRGTVSPSNAIVQIQGRPAAVGNGVFTGTATIHAGKTTVDVVASAPGATPGATSTAITRPARHAAEAPRSVDARRDTRRRPHERSGTRHHMRRKPGRRPEHDVPVRRTSARRTKAPGPSSPTAPSRTRPTL